MQRDKNRQDAAWLHQLLRRNDHRISSMQRGKNRQDAAWLL
jgi:hypothetical protein